MDTDSSETVCTVMRAPRLPASSVWLLWPLVTCILGLQHINDLLQLPIPFDAKHIYLPAAQRFLQEGWSFFLSPDSYRVVPLAYLWPAVWLGDSEAIRWANCGLWVACVFLLWSSAKHLGGNRAGAFAMIVWAINPEIYRYFPTELTEPIFLFGLLLWTWAMLQLMAAPSKALIATAALGLCITLLSRPVLQLMAPVLLLLSLGLWWRAQRQQRTGPALLAPKAIAISLLLGMLIPVALLIKNGLVFGLWGLGTGAGGGLYLGTNPLFQGAEPAYLGMGYDSNLFSQLAVGDPDHLSLAADRAGRLAGIWQLQAMPMGESASFLARKLWWWLAHHPTMVQIMGGTLRKLRLFEVITVLWAVLMLANLARRGGWRALAQRLPNAGRTPTARLLGGAFVLLMFLGLLAQLLPILYNSRYSTGLLDPWLVLLTAFGLAMLTAPIGLTLSRQSWSLATAGQSAVLTVVLTPVLLLVAANAVANYAKRHEVVRIDQTGETQTLFSLPAERVSATLHVKPSGPNRWVMTDNVAVLSVDLSPADLAAIQTARPDNAMWRLNLALARNQGGKCKPIEVAYQLANEAVLASSLLPVKADGRARTSHIHGNQALRPNEPGRLRLVFKCPIGTEITWAETSFLHSTHPFVAAQHVKAQLAP